MKTSKTSNPIATIVVFCLSFLVIATISVWCSIVPLNLSFFHLPSNDRNEKTTLSEGKVLAPTITVGPFDLHRRYRSMEGPYITSNIRIGDLIAVKQIILPESTIKFTEHLGNAPSMQASAGSPDSGLPVTSPHVLLWLKGFKLTVLDEGGKAQPTGEFLCHVNVDVDPTKHNILFPESTPCYSGRLLTLTQGQTEVFFPDGFAFPVDSDETWHFMFQAANRTTDIHRRIKQQLTLYFMPDRELVKPITALAFFNPSVQVIVDKNKPEFTALERSLCPLCNVTGRGVVPGNAILSSVYPDRFGRKISVHWTVPPGEHQWSYNLLDERVGAGKPLIVHAVWSHIHPCCTAFSFVEIAGTKRTPLWTIKTNTDTTHGVQITNIDYISSKQGILVPPHTTYQADITYNNTTGQPLDSMATMGAFFEDCEFARPKWVFQRDTGQFCGINHQ